MAVSVASSLAAAISSAHSGSDGTREAGGLQAIRDAFGATADVEIVDAVGNVLATCTGTLTMVSTIRPAKIRVELNASTYSFVAAGTIAATRLKNSGTVLVAVDGMSAPKTITAARTGIRGIYWVANVTSLDSPTCQTITNNDSSAWTNQGVGFMAWFASDQIANYPEAVDPSSGTAITLQQCDVLTRWPNGNVWTAMIHIVIPSLAAGATYTPKFRNKATSNNTPLTIAQMTAAGYDFEFESRLNAGGAGLSAKARTMLLALSDATLASNTAAWSPNSCYIYKGPVCTVIRLADHTGKSYDIGAEATKSVRPSFYCWFWPHNNHFEVLPILETTDSSKLQSCTYAPTFLVGNTSPATAYSESSGIHYYNQRRALVPIQKGNANRAKVGLRPNLMQMAAANILPQYDTTKSLSSTARSSIVSGWASASKAFGQAGLWGQGMGATAARPEIGPISHWDAAWLYDGSFEIRDIVERNLMLAGAWQIWMRAGSGTRSAGTRYYDEINTIAALGRFQSRDAFPNAGWVTYGASSWTSPDNATLIGSSTVAPSWSADTAHQPSFGGVAYALTGNPFWLEQMIGAFGFNVNYLVNGTGTGTIDPWLYQSGRDTKDTPLNHEQVRSNAWDLRTRNEVALFAPDGSPEKAYAKRCIENGLQAVNGKVASSATNSNVIHDWFYSNRPTPWAPSAVGYMANAPYTGAGLGYPRPPDSSAGMAPWMHHFWTLAVQRAYELSGSVSSVSQAAAHFTKFPVGMALSTYPQGGIDYIFPATLTSTGTFAQTLAQAVASDVNSGTTAWSWPNAATADNDGYRNQYSATVAMAATRSARAWKAWAQVLKPNVYDVCTWGDGLKYAIVPRG